MGVDTEQPLQIKVLQLLVGSIESGRVEGTVSGSREGAKPDGMQCLKGYSWEKLLVFSMEV